MQQQQQRWCHKSVLMKASSVMGSVPVKGPAVSGHSVPVSRSASLTHLEEWVACDVSCTNLKAQRLTSLTTGLKHLQGCGCRCVRVFLSV
jgi:hypothetical protein